MQSFSQMCNNIRMDVHLYQNYLNVRDIEGVFLELGACDGVLYSNTKLLEDSLNYTGVLIEPSSKFYNRLVKNRPMCKKFNCLVNDTNDICEFIGGTTGVGGDYKLLKKIEKNGRNWIDAWKLDKTDIEIVPTRKLADILHESGLTYIDFWSLDVEGGELEVLQTMDWNIPVYIICMEVSTWGEYGQKRVEQCRNILREQGFENDGKKYGLDELWINTKYFRKNILFKK